ncbi:hypothetical protein F5Y14DRAFT_449881 [Nemania sp. NC0429]|nr:hypothetical protein F5Y14DRAFT_449881 [Nemania sp. NC0429]
MANPATNNTIRLQDGTELSATQFAKLKEIIYGIDREAQEKLATEYRKPIDRLSHELHLALYGIRVQMENHPGDTSPEAQLFHRLDEVRSSLNSWVRDIVIGNERLLATIKEDETEAGIIVKSIRGHFDKMEIMILTLRGYINKDLQIQSNLVENVGKTMAKIRECRDPLRAVLDEKRLAEGAAVTGQGTEGAPIEVCSHCNQPLPSTNPSPNTVGGTADQ